MVDVPRPGLLSLTQRRWHAPRIRWTQAQAQGEPLRLYLRQLLAHRGIANELELGRYLRPTLQEGLCDPDMMADMAKATARLAQAIERQERICIFGDYDVDGVCSVALMVELLRAVGGKVGYHIPQRQGDGYGLNERAVAHIAAGYQLMVTVDCGISQGEHIAKCAAAGCEVIVCDHHQVPAQLPAAVAVLDPHRPDCPYPFKGLCAAGVAFMLGLALRRRLRQQGAFVANKEPDLRPLLDLVALATVADMVPIVDINRVLVAAGLSRMQRAPRPGIAALAAVSGVPLESLSAVDLGFRLGPRVNARGRLSDATLAVELMLTQDAAAAEQMAQTLDGANRQRQKVEQQVLAAARLQVEAQGWATDAVLVVGDPSWHCGVLGLVASRLANHFGLPAVVFGERGRGSARTAAGLDLYAALCQVREHFVAFGGHPAAAGCTLKPGHLEALRQQLGEVVRQALGPPPYARELRPDIGILAAGLTLNTASEVAALAPFGQANPEPLFVACDLRVQRLQHLSDVHLKLHLGGGCEAIAFGMGPLAAAIGPTCDLTFHLQKNIFRGQTRLQLRVVDIRSAA